MKVLVAGWFSFEQMGATAGDLLCRDTVCDWLKAAGLPFDVAHAAPFEGGVNWMAVAPSNYSHLLFVCGPMGDGPPVNAMFERFKACRLLGVNLSMLQHLQEWNPFHWLWERDSDRTAHPDLVFLTEAPRVPVVGVVLVHPQKEYGDRARHDQANAAVRELTNAQPMAIVPVDTRLDENRTGLRTPNEIESLIARMDMVITTRLHGLVLAIKHGVPALAIDAVVGGAKVLRQAQTIGWPIVFTCDQLDSKRLANACDYCQTDAARAQARQCARHARQSLTDLPRQLHESLDQNAARQESST